MALFAANLLYVSTPANSQTPETLTPGSAVVSGHAAAPEDASLRALDLAATGGKWAGAIVDAPSTFSVPASKIGQVFGLALDDATPPNIYATATSAYGLRIEGSGKDAKWAPGQFGLDAKGGPGSIWKIDGTTGEVSLFANVELNGTPNSGPGLGNISFDPVSRQLFVSDLDTGLIHRFDLNGNDLGSFDHGVTARPTTGLKALAFDAKNRLDITSDTFKSDDPKSWAFAAPGRAVWGIAVEGGRLYYAVAEGPQIWSVAITGQGGFGDDPRLELDLPASFSPNPVSDITFTADRKMILAQRGGHQGGTDKDHHRSGDNAVIVFTLELPDDQETPSAWVQDPDVVPVGKEAPFRQAAGGVAIGHGYKDDGSLDGAACKSSLWVTGDALTVEGAESIDGLQGQRATGFSKTPKAPTAVEFVKVFGGGSDKRAGGVGDIAIHTNCAGEPSEEIAEYEEPTCPGDDPRCPPPYEPPVIGPDPEEPPVYKGPDLAVVKVAHGERCNKGEPCSFEVLIRNVGTRPYYGPITFEDTTDYIDPLQTYGPAPPWSCAAGDFVSAFCRHPDTYLAPGDGISVSLTFTIPDDFAEPVYRNCANISWAPWQGYGDANPLNDRACGYAPVCQPGTPGCGPDLLIEQVSSGFCSITGFCWLVTKITNVGAQDYTGPLSFTVAEATPELVLRSYASAAEWSCGASGAANYRCFSSPVTLAPGQSREVSIRLSLPDDYAADSARQCVELNNLPGGSDANDANNYACQTFRVCSEGSDCPADLSIQFFRPFCGLGESGRCHFDPYVKNVGAQPFTSPPGSISITNDLGPGARYLPSATGTPCTAQGDGKIVCSKSLPPGGGIQPGYHVSFSYTYDVSGVTDAVRRNCVKINWPEGQSDPNPANDEACTLARVCRANAGACPADLVVSAGFADACTRGQTCLVRMPAVINMGTESFDGSFKATVSSIPGLTPSDPTLRRINGQPIGQCAVSSDGIDCSSGQIVLSHLGSRVGGTVSYEIPADFPQDQAEICLELTEVDGQDERTDNNRACKQVFINDPVQTAGGGTQDGVDLAVTKRLLGACAKAGDTCRYRIRVRNDGTKPITGEIVIDDALSPASGSFVGAGASPGWTAKADGPGKAVLTLASDSLEPGQSNALDIAFKMNADASGDIENCATVRKLPGDGNASNDKACVTVALAGDTTEPPPPPPPPGQLDLSLQISGDRSCATGQTCRAQITLRNVGSEAFNGPLSVDHSFTGGRSAGVRYSGGGAGFACVGRSFDRAQCSNASLALAPGATASYPINFTLNRAAGGAYQNCAQLVWTRGGGNQVALAQAKLNQLGYNAGTADGKLGPRTRAAILAYQRDNGLPQTGRLDEATLLRLLGPATAVDDVNRGNDRACLATTIRATCTGGRVWSGGTCVCPRGLAFIGGRCRTPPTTCTADKILVNGRCVCRKGWTLKGGVCQPPVVEACRYPGQFRGRDGKCRCPSGQRVINGACRRPVTACTADKILVNGRCVCPRGTTLQNGICQPPIVKGCPYKGQFRGRDGKCRCPSGQRVIRGQCRRPPIACTADKILVNGRCVCRRGWTLKNGICQPPVRACRYKGQIRGRDGVCRCPRGQQVIRGQCRRPGGGGPKPCITQACPIRGQTRGRDCKCRCPSGQRVINGVCRSGSGSRIPPELREKIPCTDQLRRLGVC